MEHTQTPSSQHKGDLLPWRDKQGERRLGSDKGNSRNGVCSEENGPKAGRLRSKSGDWMLEHRQENPPDKLRAEEKME